MNTKFTLSVFLFLFVTLASHGQTITTFAGGGGRGDHSPAIYATISPIRIAWHKGCLYVADQPNGAARIRKIDPAGIITSVAGNNDFSMERNGAGGPATAAALGYPSAIAFDSKDNMYIADGRIYSVAKVTPEGIITYVAGIDTNDYNGDNILATDAALNRPTALAVDAADNLYIADAGNGRVRKIDHSTGIITTVAGNGTGSPIDVLVGNHGPATAAGVGYIYDIHIDNAGTLYICSDGRMLSKVYADGVIYQMYVTNMPLGFVGEIQTDSHGNLYTASSNKVLKIDGAGIATIVAGNDSGSATATMATDAIIEPTSIAFNDAGEMLIAQFHSDNIMKMDVHGMIDTIAGDPTGICDGAFATDAPLSSPRALGFNKAGELYIADQSSSAYYNYSSILRKVDKHGIISTVPRTLALSMCAGIDGSLYYASSLAIWKKGTDDSITLVGGGDSIGFSGDGGPATAARTRRINDLITDADGNIFFSDQYTRRVRKIDRNGIINTIAGGSLSLTDTADGTLAANAYITPRSIAFDKQGALLIMEPTRIRKIDADGKLVTIAGCAGSGNSGDNGPATAAHLLNCSKMVADTAGNIYFITALRKIRKVDAEGIITTVAGGDTTGYTGDGGPSTAALFSYLSDIEIDDSGRVYVTEMNNASVRRIDTRYKYPPVVIPAGDTSGSVHIYPNPATITLTVQSYTPTAGDVHMQIYDATGRQVLALQATTTGGYINQTISLPPALPQGMYLFRLFTPSGSKVVQFVVAGK